MDRIHLLNRLWECQNQHRYISEEDLKIISQEFQLSEVEVKGVASFYHFFHFKHAGKYTIYLNNSIVAKHAGYEEIKTTLEETTGAKWGETDPTNTFGLFETPCIGLSDQEPAALINFQPFINLSPTRIREIISQLKEDVTVEDICDKVENHIHYRPDPERTVFFRPFEEGTSLRMLNQFSPEEVIQEIIQAGLKGRGGAFFPTGTKWEMCRQFPGPRYIVCNADEGEPGTFKDRVLLDEFPELLIEGMIISGYAVGAEEGMIYLRAEYRWLLYKLEKVLERYRQIGWLGEKIPAKSPFAFDIRIQLGAGAYICGEETALLASMEGRRGEPFLKQYFPVERGFHRRPTVVNNVETFCAATRILELGAEFFNSLGTSISSGTKLISVSGDCARPGLYEIEWGMSVQKLLALCGAKDPYFIQVSGPAGQTINKSDINRRIAREDLQCGGSFMVFNSQRDIMQILRNFNAFFCYESCGICTPCRAGNYIVSKRLAKIHNGLGEPEDIAALRSWGNMIKQTSRCGLGQTAPNSFLQAFNKFPNYFHTLVSPRDGIKGFDLEKAIADYEFAIKQNSSHER